MVTREDCYLTLESDFQYVVRDVTLKLLEVISCVSVAGVQCLCCTVCRLCEVSLMVITTIMAFLGGNVQF